MQQMIRKGLTTLSDITVENPFQYSGVSRDLKFILQSWIFAAANTVSVFQFLGTESLTLVISKELLSDKNFYWPWS